MHKHDVDSLAEKIDSIEEVYSRIVVSLIEMTATLNVLLDRVIGELPQEEQEQFAEDVNKLQMQSAQFLKEELDDVASQAQD